MSGRVEMVAVESAALASNPLGDPSVRATPVYLPNGYDDEPSRRYPVIYVLAGYAGHGRLMVAERSFAERLDERIERLIASGALAPAIFVFPDCYTRLGGSQYVDSTATGAYESYLVREVVPKIERRYRVDARRRAICGKSSGGYGAIRLGAQHPEIFPVVACMSGDSCFEYCYMPDFADFTVALDAHEGSVRRFVDYFAAKAQTKVSKRDFLAMNMVAMAAAYSPDPSAEMGIALPMHWPSGRVRKDVWERWVAADPVRFLEHTPGVRSLRAVWIECGHADEYRLQPGARMMAEIVRGAGVRCERREFEDGHMGLDYRFDTVLPWLAGELARL
jgi:poly(3-hydroxybutyrate) depolymerase